MYYPPPLTRACPRSRPGFGSPKAPRPVLVLGQSPAVSSAAAGLAEVINPSFWREPAQVVPRAVGLVLTDAAELHLDLPGRATTTLSRDHSCSLGDKHISDERRGSLEGQGQGRGRGGVGKRENYSCFGDSCGDVSCVSAHKFPTSVRPCRTAARVDLERRSAMEERLRRAR